MTYLRSQQGKRLIQIVAVLLTMVVMTAAHVLTLRRPTRRREEYCLICE